ncbi:MAG: right-handed parallel beta-helix repeat-containing protein [Bryobacteraceae bacterium]
MRSVKFTFAAAAIALASPALAVVYEVGPEKEFTSIGAVPWAFLQPGDTVLIHYRIEPYREKWVICRQGTADEPITVRGVPGPEGELPVIDGKDALNAPALNFWSEVRGVIKIGGANVPADTTPRHIVIENLDIRGARRPNTFTDRNGATQTYGSNASTIYLEKGENITIRNCILHDSGNGLFVASSPTLASRDILIEGNHIYDNGNEGSILEHSSYTAAIGITFQYNRYGPLRSGAGGNALKDRSAGLIVRYNWIEGGNRQLDLVDAEDSGLIRNHPGYSATHVYGNVLIEPPGDGNRQITHYGGDSGESAAYRKGTLYFYNNTIVSNRTDRTTLFRLSTNEERCDARNNVFYAAAEGRTVSLLDSSGVLDFAHNWIKPGWVETFGTLSGRINNNGGLIESAAPGFSDEAAQNFTLAEESECARAGTALDPAVLPAHDVVRQYVKHRSNEQRPREGGIGIGAYGR